MADLTRRAFIGRTLLTGATIASGGLSTISTSPTTPTVAKVATTFKNLNVLSPKARAYRSFLRGVQKLATGTSVAHDYKPKFIKSIITGRTSSPDLKPDYKSFVKDVSGRSVARHAFEHSIAKGKVYRTGGEIMGKGKAIKHKLAYKNFDLGHPSKEMAKEISGDIYGLRGKEQRNIANKIDKSARSLLAKELRAEKVANPNSKQALAEFKVRREFQAHDKHTANIQATKTTSTTSKGGGGGGGGGKWGRGNFGRHSPWHLLNAQKNF